MTILDTRAVLLLLVYKNAPTIQFENSTRAATLEPTHEIPRQTQIHGPSSFETSVATQGLLAQDPTFRQSYLLPAK